MHTSRVSTIRVPRIDGTTTPIPEPAPIVQKSERDCVVRVRNISYATYVLIAYDAAVLQSFPSKADTWRVLAGEKDEFIVAKGQSLLVSTPGGAADGEGVLISFHIFEAFPTDDRLGA